MLTAEQRRALQIIVARLDAGGNAPTRLELAAELGLRSKSGTQRLVDALVERGYLRRLPYRARALEVVRRPEAAVPPVAPATLPPEAVFEAATRLPDASALQLALVLVAKATDPACVADLLRLEMAVGAAVARLLPPGRPELADLAPLDALARLEATP